MNTAEFISQSIEKYYLEEDLNCAKTTLKTLGVKFNIDFSPQVLDAATGMHGAGKTGAQCGLVEGTLMFLGIAGRVKNIPEDEVIDFCGRFAREFEQAFGSILCRELRPEGFSPDQPPHLCENLTRRALEFSINTVSDYFSGSCK